MTNKIFKTREEWLAALVEELRPVFDAYASPIAGSIRVACGFPSNARRSGAIGECWADTASADKTMEILISPVLADTMKVAETLIHELCHTCAGSLNHGAAFQKNATAMRLIPMGSGKNAFKSTVGDALFAKTYGPIICGLGDYPHAELSLSTRPKQSTRMLKLVCPTCAWTCRTTAKHVAAGLPTCHCGDTLNNVGE